MSDYASLIRPTGFRLQLVYELIEPVDVNTGFEAKGVGLDFERWQSPRLPLDAEADSQRIVYDGLHAPVGAPHLPLQQLFDIGVNG